jgi:hypothetical protein
MTTIASMLIACLQVSVAHADAPRTATLRTVVPAPEYESFGRAVERVARARADELEVIESTGTPALELDDLQLMVGCLAETTECYRAIAQQLEVQAILVPSLEIAGEEVLVTIAFYDDRSGEMRRVVRRARQDFTEESLIDSLDGLLRELFGLPPAPPAAELPRERRPDPVVVDDDGDGALIVLPIALLGSGAAVLGLGAIFGVLSLGNESDWLATRPLAPDDVPRAMSLMETASSQGTIANIMFVAGGVLAAAGGAILIVMLLGGEDEETPQTAFAPMLFPEGGGLVLSGSLGGPL